MKKRWKIFWIVCAVLAVAGLMCAAAGAALGGIAMLRRSSGESILFRWMQGSSVQDRLEGIADSDYQEEISGILQGQDTHETAQPDGVLVLQYEYKEKLSMEMKGISVTVLPADVDEIVIDTTDCREDIREALEISEKDDEIELRIKSIPKPGTNDIGMLYVSVPQGRTFREISVEAGAGYIELQKIAAEEMTLEAGAGQIVAEEITADQLKTECGAGQILGNGEVNTEAKIKCSLGEIRFQINGRQDEYDYEISCGAGEMIIGGQTYSGIRKEVKIDNHAQRKIEAECGMGRVELNFQ